MRAIGNSLGVILDRGMLDALGIERDSEVEVMVVEGRIVLEPVRQKNDRRERVAKSIRKIMTKHAGTMRKLAK